MDLIEGKEGDTRFFIPRPLPGSAFPPSSTPVFFNPRMELSRDATVLLISKNKPRSYLDAMGGTGVRGLRVAGECGVPVTINDGSRRAVDLIRLNVEESGIPIEITYSDVNVLLSSRRFDAVDLDPFGTPAPYTDAAARSAGRFLFVTATDTAPLCGAHKKAGIRRYFAMPRNTEYHTEVGLRVLLGFVVRELAKYDRGLIPLFCYTREHYVRLHLGLDEGAKNADRTIDRIGFILQCTGCPNRVESPGIVSPSGCCEDCGSELSPIGPLWLGPICDVALLSEMEHQAGSLRLGTSEELVRLIRLCREELGTSSFYDYHRLAKFSRISPPPIGKFIECLNNRGFPATRTHYSGTGVKTDAPLPEILDAIRRRG